MKPQRQVPWCIEWSAALFLGVAAFSTITHAGSCTRFEAMRDWPFYVIVWAIYSGVAVAVVKAQNWVRWLFVGFAVLCVAGRFFGPGRYLARSTPEIWDDVEGLIALAGASLCFLPAANRYFQAKKKPNHPSEQTSGIVTPGAAAPAAPIPPVAHR